MNDLKMPLWFLVAAAMILAAAATAAAQKDPSLPAETVGAISDHLSVRFPTQGQTALEKQTVQVFYQGRPAAGVQVSVETESGWQKNLRTDADGHFTIAPLEIQRKKESYTYAITYHDPSKKKTHHLQRHVDVAKPRPEWTVRAQRFLLWWSTGLTVSVLFIVGGILIRQKNEKKIAKQFGQYRSGWIGVGESDHEH